MADSSTSAAARPPATALPRVTIQFCTQCKWMLRAAYFAQELLSTFSLSLGEVALQPSTGGAFVVAIVPGQPPGDGPAPREAPPAVVLWDRRTDGGFPETKELKRRVRDVIEPGRDLGHVDRQHGTAGKAAEAGGDADGGSGTGTGTGTAAGAGGQKCEDCP